MPGAYAHLTLVGSLAESNSLNRASGFTQEAKADLLDYVCFCDLGAVSPDYPYLDLLDTAASSWADLMHHTYTGRMLSTGVQAIRELRGSERKKTFAWLLGYAAHVVGDVTIHPVVEMKVGPYEQNKREHRVCEMHQDAHIFQRLNVGPVGLSEYLDSGIKQCSAEKDAKKLDRSVSDVWRAMFQACYPEQCQATRPDMDSWHAAFSQTVDMAEESGKLFAFSRHVAVNMGLTYPNRNEIDKQYIVGLKTPEGPMHYDLIFDRARQNVLDMWSLLAAAIYKMDDTYLSHIDDWSLDTGLNSEKQFEFWSRKP